MNFKTILVLLSLLSLSICDNKTAAEAPKNGAASPPAKTAAAVTVKPGPKQQSPGSTTAAATTAKPGAPAPSNKPAVAPGKGIAAATAPEAKANGTAKAAAAKGKGIGKAKNAAASANATEDRSELQGTFEETLTNMTSIVSGSKLAQDIKDNLNKGFAVMNSTFWSLWDLASAPVNGTLVEIVDAGEAVTAANSTAKTNSTVTAADLKKPNATAKS